jgi:hypothetical protein
VGPGQGSQMRRQSGGAQQIIHRRNLPEQTGTLEFHGHRLLCGKYAIEPLVCQTRKKGEFWPGNIS